MLDLSIQANWYKFKWIDGRLISLKPPTQRIYKELLLIQEAPSAEAIDKVYDIAAEVLKNNFQKANLDASGLSIEAVMLLLQDYFEFYTKELNKIVFQQSQ